jgi:phosphopantothenoylcysteine decarboxylase/phosphopantothenate--cysteine ligase
VKIVGFKAEAGVDAEELLKRARNTLENSELNMIIANEVSEEGMGTDKNSITILYSDDRDNVSIEGSKNLIANVLMDEITGLLTSKGEK